MSSKFKITYLDRVRIQKSIKALRHTAEKDRYADLENRINSAELIDSLKVPNDLVTMNSSIVLEDLVSGDRRTITLVYPKYADAEVDRVSVLSPLGMALFGATAGDGEVSVQDGSTVTRYRIIEILYQPELAGHYLI